MIGTEVARPCRPFTAASWALKTIVPRPGPPCYHAQRMREETIESLAAAMAAGRRTSVSICQDCLRRIERVDRSGPTLNSIIEVNPDALEIARRMDRERKTGRVRGPLQDRVVRRLQTIF